MNVLSTCYPIASIPRISFFFWKHWCFTFDVFPKSNFCSYAHCSCIQCKKPKSKIQKNCWQMHWHYCKYGKWIIQNEDKNYNGKKLGKIEQFICWVTNIGVNCRLNVVIIYEIIHKHINTHNKTKRTTIGR